MGDASDTGEKVISRNTPNINLCDTTRGHISRQQNQYSKYGDEHELLPHSVGTQINVEAGARGGNELWKVSQHEDEPGSDKGIIQTRTVTVTYGGLGLGST